jgi:hypothetical protein
MGDEDTLARPENALYEPDDDFAGKTKAGSFQ